MSKTYWCQHCNKHHDKLQLRKHVVNGEEMCDVVYQARYVNKNARAPKKPTFTDRLRKFLRLKSEV